MEVTKKAIFEGIENRLGEAKSLWIDELFHVLWAYRSTPRTTTGESPFKLAYGTAALVPVEVRLLSFRNICFNLEKNGEGLRRTWTWSKS